VHIIKLLNPSSKMTILKIIIFIISKPIPEFKPSKNQISMRSANTPHECHLRMAVTVAAVAKIMCLSRRLKVEEVSCRIRNKA
jgi:hypothetical protein